MQQEKVLKIVQSLEFQCHYFPSVVPDLKNHKHFHPYVYLLIKQGVVIYVGCTCHPKSRLKTHFDDKDFDSCLFMDFGVKTAIIRQYYKRAYIRHRLLAFVLEQYFIEVFNTTIHEYGNRAVFTMERLKVFKIVEGISRTLKSETSRTWKSYE